MKKKLFFIILLIGLLGLPLISFAKENNPLSFNRESDTLIKGNLERKEIALEKDGDEDEDEDYLFHPMVTLPYIGEHPVFAKSDNLVTIVDQNWINITDDVPMTANSVFEADKYYEYSVIYRVDPNEKRYINIVDYDEEYPYLCPIGIGGDYNEDGYYRDGALIYTGDSCEYHMFPNDTGIELDIDPPVLGGHPTYARANAKYTIVSQKWINKTTNKEMSNTDTFQNNNKYDYVAVISTRNYVGGRTLSRFDGAQGLLGTKVISARDSFNENLTASFYFGDVNDLVIETGAVVIDKTNPPEANKAIVKPNVQLADTIDKDDFYHSWYKMTDNYSVLVRDGEIAKPGNKYCYEMFYGAEMGYVFENDFEVIDNNVNSNLLEQYGSANYGHGNYESCFYIMEPGQDLVIIDPYNSQFYPGYWKMLEVFPKNDDNSEITWESSDPTIARFTYGEHDGGLEGLKPGKVTITATNKKGKKATIEYEVGVKVEEITLDKTEINLKVGESYQLQVGVLPENATVKGVYFDSNDYSVARIDYETGMITARGVGTAIITVRSQFDYSIYKTCEVMVTEGINPDSVSLNKTSTTIKKGETETLVATILPATATNKQVTWKSSDLSVARVDKNGKVTAVDAGTATITVKTANDKTATCTVTVTGGSSSTIEVSSINLNKTEIELDEEASEQLIVTFRPSNATDKTLTWTSSDNKVATVSNTGKVTAVKEGEATITVKTTNNKKATCKVIVLPAGLRIAYTTHVQSYGWQKYVRNGVMAGTQGEAKRLEGIKIKLENQPYEGDVLYRTHIQSFGWEENFKKNDEMSGTEGLAKRLEAIEIKLTGAMAEHYDVYYRVHAQSFGWLGWARNGERSGTAAYAKRLEGIEIKLVEKGQAVEGYGTTDAFKDANAPTGITLNKTTISLETGEKAKLIATVLPDYATDKTVTWSSTNENSVSVDNNGNVTAVSEGVSSIIAKTVNGKSAECTVHVLPPIPGVSYKTHVQTYGWQDYVRNGAMSGTQGEAKRLEGIQIKLNNQPYEGSILYRTHIQSFGWEEEFKKDDEMSGTSGLAKRLEAIEIKLTGEMAEHFDIYYRVHAQSFGWLGWAKNGEQSGTAALAKRLEGIEIVLVEKGENPPVRDNQNDERPFIQG